VLRLVFPLDSSQVFAAHVWQWGQCGGLFVLGLHAGAARLAARRIPTGLRRRCAWALGAGAVVVVVMVAALPDDLDPLGGGLTLALGDRLRAEGVMATAAASRAAGHLPRSPPRAPSPSSRPGRRTARTCCRRRSSWRSRCCCGRWTCRRR
jgi:hypothetical protein